MVCTYEYALCNGSLVKTTLADGTVLRNTYDKYGRVTQTTVARHVTNEYFFDNDGNLSGQTDRRAGLTTRYDYNDADKVVRSEVYSDAAPDTAEAQDTDAPTPESRIQYTYTKSGRIGTLSYREKDSGVKTYTYTYATDELPVKNTYPDKSSTDFTYDTLRRTTRTVYTPKSGAAASKKLYITYTYQAGCPHHRRQKKDHHHRPDKPVHQQMLLSQTTGDETLCYYYDNAGRMVSLGYRKGDAAETGYFYTRNVQGDINGFHP